MLKNTCKFLLRPEFRQCFLDSLWPVIYGPHAKSRLQNLLYESDFRSLCDVLQLESYKNMYSRCYANFYLQYIANLTIFIENCSKNVKRNIMGTTEILNKSWFGLFEIFLRLSKLWHTVHFSPMSHFLNRLWPDTENITLLPNHLPKVRYGLS